MDEPREGDLAHGFDDAIDPVVRVAPDQMGRTRITYANPAALAWGRTFGVDVAPQTEVQWDPVLDLVRRADQTGEPASASATRVPTADGGGRCIDVSVASASGETTIRWHDVTELAEAEERFRFAFAQAPVGMVLAEVLDDDDATYIDVNPAFAQMLAFPPDSMVGRTGTEFTFPPDRHVDDATIRGLGSGEAGPFVREKRVVRADGTTLWVRMSSSGATTRGERRLVITHVEDISERKSIEAELERHTFFDPITGLGNRTLLMDRLAGYLRSLSRNPVSIAVLYVDLDHFKDVNDALGHGAGDDVLREVASRISAAVGPDDTATRLAGDEFVVVAPVESERMAIELAERLHAEVTRPISLGHRTLVVRPSIGIAITRDAGVSPETLVHRADLAMFHAKHRGSDPWTVFDERLEALDIGRFVVEEDLRAALEHGGFRLLYQPIIDVTAGRVVSAEALLRLRHPQRGMIGPGDFIQVAEDSELIVPIGGWVLDQATRQLASWQRRWPQTELSVNVSPRQVRHLAVRDQVATAIDASGISPQALDLEITERVLLDANHEMLAELRGVTDDGCGLAIDDFGTGYSSLAYLTRFPVSELKIDRSFVDGLGKREQDTAVVEAVIGLANALGLTTVAEGVETIEQLGLLKEMGAARAQGFLLGRPVGPQRLAELLAR